MSGLDSEQITRAKNAILGAFVADAATMGFHWLYSQRRIIELAPNEPEFRTPSETDFEGNVGYFAHGSKQAGEFSHYGEQAWVMLKSMAENGGDYERHLYQDAFRDHFGYGGMFCGYIDKPTRQTLDTIYRTESVAVEKTEAIAFAESDDFPGANDEQLPAISKLPVLVARYANSPDLTGLATSAIKVTNNTPRAIDYGMVCTSVLSSLIQGNEASSAIDSGLAAASEETREHLKTALSRDGSISEVTQEFGLHCDLGAGMASILYNMQSSSSFLDAVRSNIYAGGDNCGRSIMLGAAAGSMYSIGGNEGIPEEWIENLPGHQKLRNDIERLFT